MPYLAGAVPNPGMYYNVRVSDVMSTNIFLVISFHAYELIRILLESRHNVFPVVGKKGVSSVEESLLDSASISNSVSVDLDAKDGINNVSTDSNDDQRKNPDTISTLCEE
jgi:hypothetical protein